ncbi:Protein kinase-like domain protein [Cordyceps fumosorosea ARSEF 2679]|uniref:non-specific serine/threonine protein kinase n=1 Tax=Cordyceps fumosorosea (strain ARSEF 2679) TaxID=1081104 RepID=A0A167MPS1_CORFA|nr:Protein kinase-like domain protein [Cordyceps fumosorosea ARSEF 2679]OAA54619.1 Protein kinase-like domain protein [Cordyceps fumosorosea ARSEF 2679]
MSSSVASTNFCVFCLVPLTKEAARSVCRYYRNKHATGSMAFFRDQKAKRDARAIAYVGDEEDDDVKLSRSDYRTGCFFTITEAGDLMVCDVSDQGHPTRVLATPTGVSGKRGEGIALRCAGDTCVLPMTPEFYYTISFDSGEEFSLCWGFPDLGWESVRRRRLSLRAEYEARDAASSTTRGKRPFQALGPQDYEPVTSRTPLTSHVGAQGLPLRRIHTYKQLGAGVTGSVFLVVSLRDGKEYAMKTVNSQRKALLPAERPYLIRELKKEALALDRLRHSWWTPNSDPLLWMPLCDGNAAELVKGHACIKMEPAPEMLPLVKPFLVQCLGALRYMHQRQLVHRDLKLANILYRREGPGVIKFYLADVSLMADTATAERQAHVGDPTYRPPEHQHGPRPSGEKSDIYMFGVALLEFLGMVCPKEYRASTFTESEWRWKLDFSGVGRSNFIDRSGGQDLCINGRLFEAWILGLFKNEALKSMLHFRPEERPTAGKAMRELAEHFKFEIPDEFWEQSNK